MTAAEIEACFALDAALRVEADDILARSGIGVILREEGYRAVGSYTMRTMTWRDLDFECACQPDWQRHWQIGQKLAQTGWCWRMNCVDHDREPMRPFGYWWGARATDPATEQQQGERVVWKLDLWMSRPEQLAIGEATREHWMAVMSDDLRAEIIAIKRAVCTAPEYRRNLLSVHIYEAVLEYGVCGVEAFWEWWQEKIVQR
jgi:hypothetical protein